MINKFTSIKYKNMSYFLGDFLNHLGAIELCCLKLTCRQFNETITYDKINKMIIKSIENRLKNYVGDYEEFQQFLIKTKAFISGSFIIQCILDHYYNDSDLDIYIPIKNYKETIITYNFKNSKTTSQSVSYRDFDDVKICRVVNYQFNNNKMQLIYVEIDKDRQSIIDYLTDYFDLDICKNFYRPNDLYIQNLSQIVTQKLYFKIQNTHWNLAKFMSRANKYRERGFELINRYALQNLSGKRIYIYHVEYIKYHLYRMIDGNKNLLIDIDEYINLNEKYTIGCYNCNFGNISCEDCSAEQEQQKEEYSLFNSLNDDKVIFLSDDSRTTKIDHFVDFYYPRKNTHILWYSDQYYLFVTI